MVVGGFRSFHVLVTTHDFTARNSRNTLQLKILPEKSPKKPSWANTLKE